MSSLLDVETLIVNKLVADIPNTTIRGVRNITTALMLSADITAPAVLVVFTGERAKPNELIGKTLQETTCFWDLFLVASSYSEDTSGISGVYTLYDSVITSLEGLIVVSGTNRGKVTLVSCNFHEMTDTWVIYKMQVSHEFLRTGP